MCSVPNDPENKGYRLSRGTSALGLADIDILAGNYADAHTAIAICLQEKESLANGDPENVNWRWRLSDGYRSEGRLYMYQGDLERAKQSYEKAHQTIAEFAKNDPSNLRLQWQLAEALAGAARNSAELEHRAGGVRPETVARAKEAVIISDSLVKTDESNTTWLLANTVSHMVDARVTQLTEGAQAALPKIELALIQCLDLEQDAVNNIEAKLEHLEVACRKAELLRETGDAAGAESAFLEMQPALEFLRERVSSADLLKRFETVSTNKVPVSSVLYP